MDFEDAQELVAQRLEYYQDPEPRTLASSKPPEQYKPGIPPSLIGVLAVIVLSYPAGFLLELLASGEPPLGRGGVADGFVISFNVGVALWLFGYWGQRVRLTLIGKWGPLGFSYIVPLLFWLFIGSLSDTQMFRNSHMELLGMSIAAAMIGLGLLAAPPSKAWLHDPLGINRRIANSPRSEN